jgi:hypothetical protein
MLRHNPAAMSRWSQDRVPGPEEVWDQFIDALDGAGQAGSAAGVEVPTFATTALGGKRFGELDRNDVKALAAMAAALGRRGEIIVTIWEDMRRRERGPHKAPRKPQRR